MTMALALAQAQAMDNNIKEGKNLTRNEYYKQYRLTNKAKIKANNKKYWAKKQKEADEMEKCCKTCVKYVDARQEDGSMHKECKLDSEKKLNFDRCPEWEGEEK
jgi:hypothetical protein